jgi:alpha-D-ribose 1-methylphosphonate 5-triphosphate diphosphatase
MDHTPGQRQWQDHEKWRKYQERHGKWSDEHTKKILAELAEHQARYAAKHRAEIVGRCKSLNISLASHDDTLVEHVEEAARDGIALAEFPTTLDAARAAREHGIATIMGAPNVVRGGSHSGNIAAVDLAREGLLDILSSDYIPSSLLMGALQLPEHAPSISLPAAVRTVTKAPADAVGLTDRGEIAIGKRADLIRVHVAGSVPVVRSVWREGGRVA